MAANFLIDAESNLKAVLGGMGDWTGSTELWRNLVALAPAMVVGMLVAGAVGVAIGVVLVRRAGRDLEARPDQQR